MNLEALLRKIEDGMRSALGEELVGLYLHGSAVFGCFNPKGSDIDFIVLAKKALTFGEKSAILDALLPLEAFAPPKGFEMSVVLAKDALRFRHPCPFELHYASAYREDYLANKADYFARQRGCDPDLAAHFMVILVAGHRLLGKPISEAFGPVPKADYLASIRADVQNAMADLAQNPVYVCLNLCRVLAYMEEGLVLSKKGGGEWGLSHLPDGFAGVLVAALAAYEGDGSFCVDERMTRGFCAHMLKRIFP
ncbi:MAG: DUF4111 domain-containing protein [Christensenellaceae bacterium]|jgi:streptomycin 3"-adenylyltransferase|nr:DUF4111 domain-containing protein [Christensenellaceae bacterium]